MNRADIETLVQRMDSIKGQLEYLITEAESVVALDVQVDRKAEIVRQKDTAVAARELAAKKLQQDNISLKAQLDNEWKTIDTEKSKLVLMTETVKKEKSEGMAEIQQSKRDLEAREEKLTTLEQDKKLLSEKQIELDRQKILIEKERQLFDTRMAKVDSLEKRLTDKLARVNNLLKE